MGSDQSLVGLLRPFKVMGRVCDRLLGPACGDIVQQMQNDLWRFYMVAGTINRQHSCIVTTWLTAPHTRR